MQNVLLAAVLVLTNAKVFTGDPARPWAEAIAIRDNKIAAVGKMEDVKAFITEDPASVIDLGGRVVIPGFNDAHTHPGRAVPAYRLGAPDADPSWREMSAAIAGAIDETPGDMWILATVGASIINDPAITRVQLDQLAPGRKVMLESFTGHGLIMSSAAMAALGVAGDAADPAGGWYGRSEDGRLNGRAYEYAQWAIDRRFANMATDDELVDAVRLFADEALRYGITSIQAMPIVDEARLMRAWRTAGIPIRLRVINFPFHPDAPLVSGASGVKWIFDGTPLERGAAVRKPYPGDGGKGRLNFTDLVPLVKYAYRQNQQLLVHAAGDDTAAKTLAAMQAVSSDWASRRPRIEHGDGLQRDLFDAAKRLGVIVVQNPAHFFARPAFPAEGDYQLAKSILNVGIPFAIASDGQLNPFLNILWIIERRDQPAEALTREQAVIAYTATPAFAEFKEKEKGKIAVGMLADLAVLSDDVFTANPSVLPEIRSVMTIINGKVVYQQY